MPYVMVERTMEPAVTFDDLQAIEDRSAWCFQMHAVRFVHSYVSTDGNRMICVYEAPDAESVREANRKAQLPFDRVWTAELRLGGGAGGR
jgi:hypothetical protein